MHESAPRSSLCREDAYVRNGTPAGPQNAGVSSTAGASSRRIWQLGAPPWRISRHYHVDPTKAHCTRTPRNECVIILVATPVLLTKFLVTFQISFTFIEVSLPEQLAITLKIRLAVLMGPLLLRRIVALVPSWHSCETCIRS